MARLHGPTSLVLGLIIVACTGPAQTIRPTILPTMASPVGPTAGPTPTSPATTNPPPSATSESTGIPTETAPPPSGTPVPLGWLERTDVPAGPSAREDHTWTVDEAATTAYLFGGRGAGGASDELWAFDLATDSWSQLTQAVDTPIPEPRFGHTATWVPDVGLVIWSGQGNSAFFDDIWAWKTATNSWLELASLGAVPAARYGSCASLGPDGELWISHGFTEDTGRFADTRSYDFETGSWTDRTPADRVPVERCLHDCFWLSNDQLILYGGQTTGVAALGDIWAYDLATAAWTEGGRPAAPARQLYAQAAFGFGAIVFGGGSLDGGFLADMWMIDPQSLGLVPAEVGPGPTARAGATVIRDLARIRLLLFGGTNAAGALGDLWELGLP